MAFDIKHIYFQDPTFSALDEEFLESQGYEILHSPESNDYIDNYTFLFTPGAEPNVEEASLAVAFPALYITNDITSHSAWHMPFIRPGQE